MEYSWFVERVRINRDKGMSIEKAVNKTLDDMPADYLIKPFLIGNRAEVTNMCLTEYNEEETMEMLKAEYREEGLEEGRAIGREIGRAEGHAEGRAEGLEIGVKATIRACKIANLSFSDAVESVIYGMDLSQKEAEDLVRKYW